MRALHNISIRRNLQAMIRRPLSVTTVKSETARIGYLMKRRRDHFQMGGKIGIETLLDSEKVFLSDHLAHSSKLTMKPFFYQGCFLYGELHIILKPRNVKICEHY